MKRRTLLSGLASLIGTSAAISQTPPHDMKLVMLGTGTPNATPERSGPALAITKGRRSYLFDAGPGVVRRAAAAAARYNLDALQPSHLDTVFLTHLHSDHTVGLPDLMLTPWVLERAAPLRVYGPEGTMRMTRLLQQAYAEDIKMRLYGGEPSNRTGWRTETTEIGAPGLVVQDDQVRIEAIRVRHGAWDRAYGYSVSDGARTIVISGDTAPCQAIVDAARGADILVHEVYSSRHFHERTPEWQRYHAAFHTSTQELADIARRARPLLLVLTHQLFWGATSEELIAELREYGYDGTVVSANDLDMF